jgi:hypothetical protein
MQIFKITKSLDVFCDYKNTSYGFKHTATIVRDGYKHGVEAKRCYYNRTWESFEYQSVLETLLDKAKDGLTPYELKRLKSVIKNGGKVEAKRVKSELKTVAMVASLGAIFGKTQKEANDWKARMIKAGLENKGLIMPEDWETLSEDEKERRLDGVIASLNA